MIGLSLILAAAAAAQVPSAADLAEIDRTIRAVYEVVSGPPGKERNLDRMRGLTAPGTLLKMIGPNGLRGGTVEDFITRNGEVLEQQGFTERELGRRTEVWGSLATVWSAYEGRTSNGIFHERGINSFQLVKVDGRWLVASILWQPETPANPLPADLVQGTRK